jgi:methylglutaconyl-CoA hydratase
MDALLIDATDPAVTTLTLNRPDKRNALNIQLMERLAEAVSAAAAEPIRRVIVIQGAGPAFCAGLDFHEAQRPEHAHRSSEALAALYLAICRCPLLTIAAAHGAAFGGGAGLLAACDIVVASDDLRLAYPEVHRGLVAALVTCLLRRQVSDRMLRELVLLGQTLTPADALRLGLVNRIVPAATLAGAALELARQACKGAPGAMARTKALLDSLQPIEAELKLALHVHRAARDSDEAREGIAAFFEKRSPVWPPRSG